MYPRLTDLSKIVLSEIRVYLSDNGSATLGHVRPEDIVKSYKHTHNQVFIRGTIALRDAIDPSILLASDICYIQDADGQGNQGASYWTGTVWTTPLVSVIDKVNDVANIAARDALITPSMGNIALITDADGSGNKGISFRTANGWSIPFLSSTSSQLVGAANTGNGVGLYKAVESKILKLKTLTSLDGSINITSPNTDEIDLSFKVTFSRYRGTVDASAGNIPTDSSGGVHDGDAIKAGDQWLVSTQGTISGIDTHDTLSPGDFLVAKVDNATLASHFTGIEQNTSVFTAQASTDNDKLGIKIDLVNNDYKVGYDILNQDVGLGNYTSVGDNDIVMIYSASLQKNIGVKLSDFNSGAAINMYTQNNQITTNRTIDGNNKWLQFDIKDKHFNVNTFDGALLTGSMNIDSATGITLNRTNATDTLFAQYDYNLIKNKLSNVDGRIEVTRNIIGLVTTIEHANIATSETSIETTSPTAFSKIVTAGGAITEILQTKDDVELIPENRIKLKGTVNHKVLAVTANITLEEGTHSFIYADATLAGFTITLPASPQAGDTFFIAKDGSSSNDITVSGNGNSIHNFGTYIMNVPYENIQLTFNGTFWSKFSG